MMVGKPERKFSGDRNQCPTCGRYFNSTSAFDKHRAGAFGVDRRCMSEDEMRERGMCENAAGFWIGSKRPESFAPERQ